MTAVAVGVDIVEVDRIRRVFDRYPRRFLDRHFTTREQDECRGDPQRLATRFAAKEAAAKALGTGIGPIGWRDVEIACAPDGAPRLVLHGPAMARATRLGISAWSVSLSHTSEQAIAVVAGVG